MLQEHEVEVVVAFNASFEAMCLTYNAEAYGIAGLEVELVCLQRVALGLLGPGESGWLSLRSACEQVGVEEVPTHRAVADCVATVQLAGLLSGTVERLVTSESADSPSMAKATLHRARVMAT